MRMIVMIIDKSMTRSRNTCGYYKMLCLRRFGVKVPLAEGKTRTVPRTYLFSKTSVDVCKMAYVKYLGCSCQPRTSR